MTSTKSATCHPQSTVMASMQSTAILFKMENNPETIHTIARLSFECDDCARK